MKSEQTAEVQRLNPRNMEAFNVSVNFQRKEIGCELVGFFTDKEALAKLLRGTTLYPASSTRFENVGLTGGSSNIVRYRETGRETIVSVWRDAAARAMPRKLDNLSGHPSTMDIRLSSLLEAAEEVVLVQGEAALVPDFINTSLSSFSSYVESTVAGIVQGLQIPTARKVPVKLADFEEPYILNGEPVAYALVTGEDDNVRFFNVMLRPIVYTVDTAKEPLTFRESLGVETGGEAHERRVVEIDMKSTETIVHEFGKIVHIYPTIQDFISQSDINRDAPFTPSALNTMLELPGVHELTTFAKELIREPERRAAFNRLS